MIYDTIYLTAVG